MNQTKTSQRKANDFARKKTRNTLETRTDVKAGASIINNPPKGG